LLSVSRLIKDLYEIAHAYANRDAHHGVLLIAAVVAGYGLAQDATPELHVKEIKATQTPEVIAASFFVNKRRTNLTHISLRFLRRTRGHCRQIWPA
jgi:hypothetical protein